MTTYSVAYEDSTWRHVAELHDRRGRVVGYACADTAERAAELVRLLVPAKQAGRKGGRRGRT